LADGLPKLLTCDFGRRSHVPIRRQTDPNMGVKVTRFPGVKHSLEATFASVVGFDVA